jgi:hypothetical protein
MQKPTDPKQDAPVARALGALDAKGIEEAVSVVTSCGDPLEAGRAFSELGKKLYRERKNVTAMIAIGEAGVAFCLRKANNAARTETATSLKKLARTIAFNTATNCWPGWGDDGIRIDQSHLQSGLTLAGLCRELVDELHLGQRARGGADWLIGALKLAAGRPSEALPDFERARRTFEVAGDTPYELMARGYIALARNADPISASVGAGDFATALQALRNEGSKDALFFVEQLVVAERILLAH